MSQTAVAVVHPRAGRAVLMLSLASALAAMDRNVPLLFMDRIKGAFALTDPELAWLTGFSFAVSVSLFGLVAGALGDRYQRVRILAAGVMVWSLATTCCGFAGDFWSLFALRLAVGVGEGVFVPIGISLIADLYPPARIARPIAIGTVSGMIGGALGYSGGALVEGWLVDTGLVSPNDGWRGVLIVFGLLGLPLTLAMLTVPEPRRERPSLAAAEAAPPLFPYVRKTAPFVVPYLLAGIAYSIFNAGYLSWLAPYFGRTFGWSTSRIGQVLGMTLLAASLLGAPLGVALDAAVRRRWRDDSPVATVVVLTAVSVPLFVAAPLLSNPWAALCAMALGLLLSGAATVVNPVIYTTMAPPLLRARMVALLSLAFGLIGGGTGAVVYAQITESLAGGPDHLWLTLSGASAVLLVVSTVAFSVCLRRYPQLRAIAAKGSS